MTEAIEEIAILRCPVCIDDDQVLEVLGCESADYVALNGYPIELAKDELSRHLVIGCLAELFTGDDVLLTVVVPGDVSCSHQSMASELRWKGHEDFGSYRSWITALCRSAAEQMRYDISLNLGRVRAQNVRTPATDPELMFGNRAKFRQAQKALELV